MPDIQVQPLGGSGISCREFMEAHSDYLDGLLKASDMRGFDEHAATCRSCGSYDRTLRRGLLLARNLPEIQPSSHFHESLQARLMGLEAEPPRQMMATSATALMVAAVLVLIALTPLMRLVDWQATPVAEVPAVQPAATAVPGAVSGAVLVRTPENSNFSPVVIQPPALQPVPSAPRLIAYPLLQVMDR